MPAPKPSEKFMDLVQLHERAWGTDNYAGKPNLIDILNSPVTVFWKPKEGNEKKYKGLYTVTLHKDMNDVEDYLLKMLTRASIQHPDRYMSRIFRNRERVILQSVRFIFKEIET
jgi:hypothetical protein